MAKIRNDKGKGLRCYIYTRVSTEMQIDGYSLDAQEESLRKAAAYHEMQVVHVFSDEGKSGKNTTGRPEFQEMMRRISNGNEDRVDYVLVFKLSRFGRNTADVLNNVQLMEDFGVNLLAVEDNIDSAGSAGKLMISVIAAVAEIERENIAAQTMAGRRQKAKEGKWNGGQAPYGYRIKDGVLEIDEAEAEVVRLIFDRYNHHEQGANGVARWLNNNGYTKKTVKNREGTAFSAHFIKIILDNPVYIGKIAYGRRKTEKIEGTRNEYHKVKQAEGDYDLWDGRHPAIIDEKTWAETRAKREETSYKREKTHSLEHEHVLSGILKCPVCGDSMYGVPGRKKRPDGSYYENSLNTFYYVCKHRRVVDGKKCTFKAYINQDDLDTEVRHLLRDLWENGEADNLMQYAMNMHSDKDQLENRLKELEQNRHKAILEKDRRIAEIDRLDILDPLFEMKYADSNERLTKAYEKIEGIDYDIREVETDLTTQMEAEATKKGAHEALVQITENWDEWTSSQKKRLVQAWIKELHLFTKKQKSGAWIKGIVFQFPVVVFGQVSDAFDFPADADDPDESFQQQETTDETVVLLSQRRPTPQST